MLSRPTPPRRAHRFVALGLATLLVLAAGLATMPALAIPTAATLPGTIDWDNAPQIISNGTRSGFPRVAVDSNNITHAIYATESAIFYTDNRTGVFNRPGKSLQSGSYGVNPSVSIKIGPNNSVHVVYTRVGNNFQVYYRMSPDGGATWTDPQQISSGSKSYNSDLAVDPVTGDAHIVWIDARCGSTLYNVYYRVRRADGTLSGTSAPKGSCSTYQSRPSITLAGGKPHVVFQNGQSGSAEIYYARLEGNQWVNQNISKTSLASQNPWLASDGGNNLFVAWDENTNGHDIRFITSSTGGQSWLPSIPLSDTPAYASQPYVAWSAATGRAYTVWADKTDSDDGKEEIWEREFNPITQETTAADRISHFNGESLWPAMAIGPQHADIVWHDKVEGNYDIWDWGGTANTTNCITNPGASLTLNGGSNTTKQTTITGVITPPSSCTPDQMQVSLDTPVTDATAKIGSRPAIPAQIVPAGGCVAHTVYVRLIKSGTAGPLFSDSITVDTTVEASVIVSNPHLIGLTTNYIGKVGADNGDPRFTRDPKYYLKIANAGDCSGLKKFSVRNGGPSGSLLDGDYESNPALPNEVDPERAITVDITDTLDNDEAVQQSLVYDPVDPTLDMTKSPTVTAPLSTNSIIVPLKFEKINVNDLLYGQFTGLSAGDQFWGAWIATSTSDVGPNGAGLEWFAVPVAEPGQSFTLQWSLFSGIPQQQRLGNHDYYIYVKFLDGAGNATANSIRVKKVHLAANFTVPTLRLPMIYK